MPGFSASLAAMCAFLSLCACSRLLAVGIEEEVVEPVAQIIMMRDILLRSPRHVDPADPPCDRRDHPARPARIERVGAAFPDVVGGHQGDQALDVVAIDRQPALHIGLARTEPGVADDEIGRALVGEADRDVREGRIGLSKVADRAIGMVDCEGAALDTGGEESID
jgi:hypothetical protein